VDKQGRAIVQAVRRRLPNAAARVQNRIWSCGILWWTKVALGQVFSENFGFPCQSTVICFSTIIFIITRGWHNRPGVAVPIASQSRIKKKSGQARLGIGRLPQLHILYFTSPPFSIQIREILYLLDLYFCILWHVDLTFLFTWGWVFYKWYYAFFCLFWQRLSIIA
jgi:hypothetical protein